jgi:hypothetical protein
MRPGMGDIEVVGGDVVLRLNPKVYSLEMVYATAYVFLDRAWFLLDGDPAQELAVRITPRQPQQPEQLRAFGQEFLNELLSVTNYFNQLSRNKDVVNAVLQRALFSVSPKLVEEAEESEINKILQDIQNDVKL